MREKTNKINTLINNIFYNKLSLKNLLILTGIIMILPFNISHAQIEPDPSQPVGPTNKYLHHGNILNGY